MNDAARPEWLDTELYPFRSNFIDLEGARVHYLDEGSGPTLLLLHGNPTWSFLYRDIVRDLGGDFRCIAPDYPGFGFSQAPAGYGFTPAEHAAVIRDLVEALDLQAITVVMQDWGGPIGLWTAARAPERYAGLVIGNTWAWPVNGDVHFEWFSGFLGSGFGRLLIRRFNFFVNCLIPAGVTRKKLDPAIMAAYRGPFAAREARLPTHVFPREITGSRVFLKEVQAGLDRLPHLPALILWGDRDFAFRRKERERFERTFPNHETRILSGAGHFIQEDAPAEIAAAIRAWHATALSGRGSSG